jgi:DNA polymerase Ligase (LigD)
MFRFVILLHETPPGYERATHWDLMFEQGSALRTWALAEEPQVDGPRAGATIDAEQLPNHRLEYLDYEGPVSGSRGQVTQWDGGTFELECDTADEFAALVSGRWLRGRVRLVPLKGGDQRWGFSFVPG